MKIRLIKRFILGSLTFSLTLLTSYADDVAISHGPIGVMGEHTHKKGESMISVRLMHMTMKGNALNDRNISDSEILNLPNPFSSIPNMPTKLSVIPKNMLMRMVMLGGMYAPSDNLTLMGMAMFNQKGMELNTHKGMMGREYLGSFDTSSSDLSNISIIGLYKLFQNRHTRSHVQLGFQKGVGENTRNGSVLTPMNTWSSITLPYGMQSSDRSLRIISGITNVSKFGGFVLGNQLIFNSAIEKADWFLGNILEFDSWLQRALNKRVSYSARINYKREGGLGGRDNTIMAPVQTADPSNYGGKILNLGLGVNTVFRFFGNQRKDRIAFELIFPLSQTKNGLQMKDSFTFIMGYQRMFG